MPVSKFSLDLTAGWNVLDGEENYPDGENVRGICPRANVHGEGEISYCLRLISTCRDPFDPRPIVRSKF